MEVDFFNSFKKNHKSIGIITNFFSKQFLEKEFDVFQVPKSNFLEYIKINDISAVIMDNDIYETDHVWFGEDRSGLISHLNLNNIDIIFIKNSDKSIWNSFLDYQIIDINLNDEEKDTISNLSIPIILNEDKFNPIKSVKKVDVLYLKKGKLRRTPLIQKFHAALNPLKAELVYEKLSRKLILNIIEKIKESKCIYIYEPSQMDSILLKYIELVAVLQNTVVLYSDTSLWSRFALINEEAININYMAIIKEDTHYSDKILLPLQRKAFLKHTFIYYASLDAFIKRKMDTNIKVEVSVITSTNRKNNIKNYINQMCRQNHMRLQVILVTHGFTLDEDEKKQIYNDCRNFDIEMIEAPSHLPLGYCLNTALSRVNSAYVAKMDDDDYYFENYLIDSWIAAKYSDADLVGKLSTYTYLEGSKLIISKHKNSRRKYNNFVMGATFFSKSNFMKRYMFSYLATGEDSDFLRRINEDNAVIYADHPYNFCIYRGNDIEAHTWKITDIDFMKNSKIESYDTPEKLLSF